MTEIENPHAGQGMVVLDIGGDIGALVVSTPADMVGVEIEIAPTGSRGEVPDEGGDWWDGDWHSDHHTPSDLGHHGHDHHDDGPAWPHVAVLGRPSPVGTQHTAVYPGLLAGTYDLWVRPDGPTALTTTVKGGEVTEVTWP